MTDAPSFSATLPELVALAQLAGVDPSKMAAAFSDPEQFFQHISLDELARIKVSTDLLAALSTELAKACDVFLGHAKGVLANVQR
jgi:AMMECR1 domain-containing protein